MFYTCMPHQWLFHVSMPCSWVPWCPTFVLTWHVCSSVFTPPFNRGAYRFSRLARKPQDFQEYSFDGHGRKPLARFCKLSTRTRTYHFVFCDSLFSADSASHVDSLFKALHSIYSVVFVQTLDEKLVFLCFLQSMPNAETCRNYIIFI